MAVGSYIQLIYINSCTYLQILDISATFSVGHAKTLDY